MADLVFMPIADKIKDASYSCYDGACGTGGMLTVAQDRLLTLAKRRGKEVAIHLFGQEINPETYAICTADMLLKGDGEEAEHIMYGSTLSGDQHATRQFDFMLSNPPYGKSWKTDAEKMGGKKDILDTRFNTYLKSGDTMTMLPRTSDGQLLFLLNNVSKMKTGTPLDDWTAFAKATGLKAAALKKLRPFITEKDPTTKPIDGEPDVDLRDTENVPFTYEGGIDAFIQNEVLTYAPDAWVNEKKTQIGYEISFTKYFYKPVELRKLSDILQNLKELETEADGLLAEVMEGVQ